MAVNTLCTAFRRIAINRKSNLIARSCSTHLSKKQDGSLPLSLHYSEFAFGTTNPEACIKFKPGTLNIDFGMPNGNGIINNRIEIPFANIPAMEDPLKRLPVQQDLPLSDKSFELPPNADIVEKQAVRLIVIRRKKMKKHKRRKRRRKTKFMWITIRARRNVLKEKKIQANLVGMIEEAKKFDAKRYVMERLAILNKERLPRTWMGELLPPAMIRQFMAEEKAKEEARRNKPRLTLDD